MLLGISLALISALQCHCRPGEHTGSGRDTGECDKQNYYPDDDGDGWGTYQGSVEACNAPAGYSERPSDCDDSDPAVNPGASEAWYDGVDQDCSGGSDFDADGDGFEHSSGGGDDCDDENERVNPAARDDDEDGVDNDCDGNIDDDFGVQQSSAAVSGSDGDSALQFVESSPDLDGDGFPDLIIGSPFQRVSHACEGMVYLVPGPISGLVPLTRAVSTVSGDEEYDQAGSAIDAPGDVNGDGLADLAFGAPGADDLAERGGAAHLFLGPIRGNLVASQSDVIIYGVGPDSACGTAVSGMGDVSGDGTNDLVIGAPGTGYQGEPGLVAVLWAKGPGYYELDEMNVIIEGEPDDEFGYSIGDIHDLDGDGIGDVVVGAPGWDYGRGAVYLFTGVGEGGSFIGTDDFSAKMVGEVTSDIAGASLESPGDLNGDGHNDLAVGAPGASEGSVGFWGASHYGRTYLVHGPFEGTRPLSSSEAVLHGDAVTNVLFHGPQAGAGYALGSGDLDLDGVLDLTVGSPGQCGDAGAVWVVFGPVSGTHTLSELGARILGEEGAGLGYSLSSDRDLDEDGVPDLVAASQTNQTVYLFSGGL